MMSKRKAELKLEDIDRYIKEKNDEEKNEFREALI